MASRQRALAAALVGILSISLVLIATRHPRAVSGKGSSRVLALPNPRSNTPVPAAVVTPGAPLSFVVQGPAFQVHARVCTMPNVRPLDPPGDQHHTVCWVDPGFGVAPGSDSRGTSYILGHAWAEDALEVLNPLSIYAMKRVDLTKPVLQGGVPTYPVRGNLQGYRIILTTARGTLVYGVRDAYAVPKSQASHVPALMDVATPNRVVIITCGVRDGQDVDVNVIVDAFLTSSTAS